MYLTKEEKIEKRWRQFSKIMFVFYLIIMFVQFLRLLF